MKKSIISLLLILCMMIAILPATTLAATEGYYTYTVSGGKATITDFSTDISGAITVPSTLGGYPVTSIGSSAFYYCSNLTGITLPKGVTSIGGYAFCFCDSLTSLTIPEGVTSIGDYMFGFCSSLMSITIPEGITSIGDYAFHFCSSLTSITLPEEVTSIGDYAFCGCSSLTSLTIPEGVTSIGACAFHNCSSLMSITLPEGVTSISANAFNGCSSLTSIIIPEGVTSIGFGAFYNCGSLSDVYYSGSQEQWNKIAVDSINDGLLNAEIHYNYGCAEIGIDESPFDLTVDGYSFANSYGAFGYNKFSKISLEAYISVYGQKGKQLRKSASAWGGSCFGMSATAALFNDGNLDANDYVSDLINLNESAYSRTKKGLFSGKYYNYIDKNQEARKLIEKYQIWQHSSEGQQWLRDIVWAVENAEANQVAGNLSDVLKNYDNYIVALYWPGAGHAVVIDSNRPPIDLGDGWYRIYIYDPNNPYFGHFDGGNAESYYDYSLLRYIEVNVVTNHWRVDVGVNGDSSPERIGYDDNDNHITGCQIRVLKPVTLPTSFDGTADWYYSNNSTNTANLCCTNATIYDTKGDIVFRVVDNKIADVDDSIMVETEMSFLVDNITNSYIIELPFDEFTIEFQSEGTAQVFNEDYVYGLVSDAESSATVTTSDGVTVNGGEDSSVDVVVEHVNDDDTFTSVNVIVENDGQNSVHISLDDNNVLNVDSANDRFDATIYWDGQENEYLIEDVIAAEIENTDITEYALATGAIVPNDINDADLTYNDVFVQDGTVKTISPEIKYQGKKLELGVDYIIEGETSETATGTYSVTVIGQGNYCGSLVIEYEIIPAIAFKGASLSLQHDLAINYKVDKAFFEDVGYIKPYVVFELNGEEMVVDSYTVSDNRYVFDFAGIIPHQMNDTIYATLYATYNGMEYASETREYSVAEYCYNMLGKCSGDEYAEFRTLLVDLLNYGAESQEYMDYNIDALVNANLTEEQRAWGTSEERTLETVQDTEYKTIENPTVLWKGAGLNLQESVGMRFKIAAENIENLTVKVTNDIGQETIITSDTFEATQGGYYVFFDGLNAGQMSEVVYLTVYEGDTAVSHTIRYSIESYAYAKQDDTDTKLAELVKAMIKYGDSAYAYVN